MRTTDNWYSVALARFGLARPRVMYLRCGVKLGYERRLTALEVFHEQPYRPLDVRGRDVLDIGAFNGDSALYFSLLRGARRVYALEPVPGVYRKALENLSLNGAT
ncbi:MAG: FkbM family methyltransferase, partial [Nitrososphaerota archaeon]|nr:FkbM family methyltransferase [Nitrososphaerota archaeon]